MAFIYQKLTAYCDTIELGTFKHLESLEYLHLSNNKLTDLNKLTFESLYQLKYLNLSHNYLSPINNVLFSDLFKLLELDLSYNSLVSIEDYSFKNFYFLTELHLEFQKAANLILTNSTIYLENNNNLKNVYISFDVLAKSKHNQIQLVDSLNHNNIEKVAFNHLYYRSINVNALFVNSSDGSNNRLNECFLIIYFIRYQIHFNLKSDSDVSNFLNDCNSINSHLG